MVDLRWRMLERYTGEQDKTYKPHSVPLSALLYMNWFEQYKGLNQQLCLVLAGKTDGSPEKATDSLKVHGKQK